MVLIALCHYLLYLALAILLAFLGEIIRLIW